MGYVLLFAACIVWPPLILLAAVLWAGAWVWNQALEFLSLFTP